MAKLHRTLLVAIVVVSIGAVVAACGDDGAAGTTLRDAVGVAVGGEHTCARRASGDVVCWGSNRFGQLGDGTMGHSRCQTSVAFDCSPTPVAAAGVTDIVEIAAGTYHTCARRASGAVICWGSNQFGQLGDGSMAHSLCEYPSPPAVDCSLTPVAVLGLADAVEIAAGSFHTCARRASGQVMCWGGESGATPTVVLGLTDAVEIAVGASTCARRASGEVVCWGGNGAGQLGDGTMTDSPTPVAVSGLTDAVELSAGDGYPHACARRASGAVVCWGSNDTGELGDGIRHSTCIGFREFDCSLTPVTVAGLTDAVEISAGSSSTCARRASGEIVCWGLNHVGQFGDGTMTGSPTPVVAAPGLTDAIEISGGMSRCAVRTTGAVMCWGYNAFGQLGDGSMSHSTCSEDCSLVPVTVVAPL